MTHEILAGLLRVNLVGAAAILLVLALRRPLRRLAGPRVAYGLWALAPLAAAASLLPAREAPLPLLAALPEMTFGGLGAPLEAAAAPAAGFDATTLILFIWAMGALLSVAALAALQGRSVIRLGRLVPVGDQGALRAEQSGFGPAVIGALFPKIVVPADFEGRFTARERTVILAHETTHLSRLDPQVNALVVLGQCLCWFNPVVHIAAFFVRLDQELACDAAVLARYPEARRSYAEAMLKTQLAPAHLPLGCYWPARSEHPLKERLAMLKLTPPGRVRRLAGAGAVTLIALGSAYAAWAAKPPAPPIAAVADLEAAIAGVRQDLGAAPAQAFQAGARAAQASQRGPAAGVRPAPAQGDPQQDVCLTNACVEAARAAAPASATAGPPAGALPGSFNAQFDASSPALIRGKVVDVRRAGPELSFMIAQDDGKLYRVIGSAERIPPEADAQLMNQTMVVRGYLAWDRSCNDGCAMNGRDVTFADGRRLFTGQSGTGAPRDGTDAAER